MKYKNKYERVIDELITLGYGSMKCFGNSMTPILKSGSMQTFIPQDDYEVGDIVFCRVRGNYIDSHIITQKSEQRGWMISNNHGHQNGWTKNIYGRLIKSEDDNGNVKYFNFTEKELNKIKEDKKMTQVNNKKLYVVTRQDIDPGYQSVQACHSAIQFQHEFPEISKQWHEQSKYLACLSTRDENTLKELIQKAEKKNIKYSVFIEPDIDNQITSVAFEPSDATRRLTSSLPLMLKNIKKNELQGTE